MSQGDRTAMNMNNMQQMNNMNMNVGAIPGGAPNGPGAPQMVPNPGNMNAALPMQRGTEKTLLNTYIYEYFLKNEMFECAKSLLSEAEVSTIQGSNSRRQSPSRRQKHDADGNLLNGIDENMDTDRKEDGEGGDRRDDLPLPKVPAECPGGSFLFDWWSLFWDIFGARTSKQGSMAAMTYLNSTQVCAPLLELKLSLICCGIYQWLTHKIERTAYATRATTAPYADGPNGPSEPSAAGNARSGRSTSWAIDECPRLPESNDANAKWRYEP